MKVPRNFKLGAELSWYGAHGVPWEMNIVKQQVNLLLLVCVWYWDI